ncbi:ATP-dependent RNA helicase dbp4 [Psilocybe cubensis]|uniref:ATP-dependent RNA helicase dbp4 n=2 Tax=Psilocybe cubensis TaxID=181762 RepID=A0ACB8GI18_PSICU|nr:ATP-dependent RNA helicase dbp4 [Psilocybe cubensis]KAH9474710.1 ATP-dependent RNA helicase dbp4 [Psilocybe cubensis]
MIPLAGPSRQHAPNKNKNKQKQKQKPVVRTSKLKKVAEKQKIEALERDAMSYEPPVDLEKFADLPLSEPTKRGLKKAAFVTLTPIQKASIPISLQCKDVLGAARTGSGKTLAFLVPVLDILYRRRWSAADGLGALIVSPTRELAVQIFDVLRSIGGFHSFSAGLVIGGKSVKDESDRLSRMNILVATPGRLLQHMDQTVGFDAGNLQILVLDEADRILDMGFQRTLTALLGHLPASRQTLLFSATQTDKVSDLARLSLKAPVTVGDPSSSSQSEPTPSTTPSLPPTLTHTYILTPLPSKLSLLWSFLKTHLHAKTIVFFSSCKQVAFAHAAFCRMHPGVPLLALHGRMKMGVRMEVFGRFVGMGGGKGEEGQGHGVVLFATDIAARGLDFPSVDWVIQLDAPEDAETYIHRVGRTARLGAPGRALLFLLPSEEEGMLRALEERGVSGLVKGKVGKKSLEVDLRVQLQGIMWKDVEIKYLGQKAFISYLRSVHLQKDKSIFSLDKLPVKEYAESLGLPGVPKIKFGKGKKEGGNRGAGDVPKKEVKKVESAASASESEEESEGGNGEESSEESGEEEDEKPNANATHTRAAPEKVRTKYDRMFERKNQSVLSAHYARLVAHGEDEGEGEGEAGEKAPDDDDDDFIVLKRADHDLSDEDKPLDDPSSLSKRKQKMLRSKAALSKALLSSTLPSTSSTNPSTLTAPHALNTKLIFDASGTPHQLYELASADQFYEQQGGVDGVRTFGEEWANGIPAGPSARAALPSDSGSGSDYDSEGADGYVSPDFDLPPLDSDEEAEFDKMDMYVPPSSSTKSTKGGSKKRPRGVDEDEDEGGGGKKIGNTNANKKRKQEKETELEDEEALALKLLGRA